MSMRYNKQKPRVIFSILTGVHCIISYSYGYFIRSIPGLWDIAQVCRLIFIRFFGRNHLFFFTEIE